MSLPNGLRDFFARHLRRLPGKIQKFLPREQAKVL
jgi:hypothetical protein